MKLSNLIVLFVSLLFTTLVAHSNELEWTHLNGPFGGGKITCLHYDEERNTIWAGSEKYGLFKSDDLAQTWQQVPIDELFGKYINCIAQARDFIYVGTTQSTYRIDRDTFSIIHIPLYRSGKIKVSNKFMLWSITMSKKLELYEPEVENLSVINLPDSHEFVSDIDFDENDGVYILIKNRLYVTKDLGATWNDLTPTGGFRSVIFDASGLDVQNSENIYVASVGWPGDHFHPDPQNGCLHQYTAKNGWTYQETILPEMCQLSSLSVYDNIICASPNGFSLDNGTTWNIAPFIGEDHFFTKSNALIYTTNSQLIGSNSCNLFIADDLGQTWQTSNNGLNFAKKLDFHPNGDLYITSESGQIFRKSNFSPWEPILTPPGSNYPVVGNVDSNLTINSAPGFFVWTLMDLVNFVSSTNDGISWGASMSAYSMNLESNSYGHIYTAYSNTEYCRLYKSFDNGITVNEVAPELFASSTKLFDFKVDKEDVLYVLVGIPLSTGYEPKLYISYDDGASWIVHDIPNKPYRIFREVSEAKIEINPVGHLFCSLFGDYCPQDGACCDFAQQIYSKDGGKTWESLGINGTFYSTFAHSSGQMYLYNHKHEYTEPEKGMYISANNGKTWVRQEWDKHIIEFKEHYDGTLYAVTPFQGVYAAKPPARFTPKLIHSYSLPAKQAFGTSWIDFNNDGFDDLFITNHGPNELYENNGDGTFTKIENNILVTDDEPSRTATWGDFDNDGDEDVFIANEGTENSLYRNDGNKNFTKINNLPMTAPARLHRGCAWGDYNNDGWLDLYVTNRSGRNLLYQNVGAIVFTEIEIAGITTDSDKSYGCSWCDFDMDGKLDLFVANKGANAVYRQCENGEFVRLDENDFPDDGAYSFGGSWGDFNNDGYPDLFVTNADGNNALYSNNRNGSFNKINGLHFNSDEGVSKGSGWADYDNDGDLDLFVANNGPMFFYENGGHGIFAPISAGSIVDYQNNSLSVAWGDANNDGKQDIFLSSYDSLSLLYENKSDKNNWFKVKCIGTESNRSGIGAIVKILIKKNGVKNWQMRQISAQTGHASANSLTAHFGIGNADGVDSLAVLWPSGIIDEFKNPGVNHVCTVYEGSHSVPVELAQFKAASSENGIFLSWVTNSESNNWGFEIQRKLTDSWNTNPNWEKIGFVSGKGTSLAKNSYTFNDPIQKQNEKIEYRLKQIDFDGTANLSETVCLYSKESAQNSLNIYPNPFNSSTTLEIVTNGKAKLSVFDVTGRLVKKILLANQEAGRHLIKWDATDSSNIPAASGLYFVVLETEKHLLTKKLFLVR